MTHRVLKSHRSKMSVVYIYVVSAMYNRTLCAQVHELIGGLVITERTRCLSFWLHIDILRSSYLCEIWALFVSCVTSNQIYYAPCLTCWALFGSLAPLMCNRASCVKLHELPWGLWRIGNNREGKLSIFLTTYVHIRLILLLWDLSTPRVMSHF